MTPISGVRARRSLRRGVLLAVVAALLPLPASAAAKDLAAESDQLQVQSYVLPPGADVPSLEELQSAATREKFQDRARELTAAQVQVPLETVGPARSYGRLTQEPSASQDHREPANSRAAAPAGVTYPDPAQTMTPAQCRKGLGSDKKFYIRSRFAVCSGALYQQVWTRNGRPVGRAASSCWPSEPSPWTAARSASSTTSPTWPAPGPHSPAD